LSFVRRVGRVARGDESGDGTAGCAKLAQAPWLRQTLLALQAEPAPRQLTIDRFLEILLAATRQRFVARGVLAGDVVPLTFRSLSMRAVWAASVFWRALELNQFGAGQKQALRSIRPNQVRRIACGPTGPDRDELAAEYRRQHKLAGLPPGSIVRPRP
jgi:hypothetical protein